MSVYIIGDVHGQLEKLIGLLRDSHLISPAGAWTGGHARLYFLGDYVDRGPDGLGVIDLVMRLQVEAAMKGGHIEALLGNHDVMLLAARRIGNQMPEGADLPLRFLWQQNGGRRRDLDGLTEDQAAWLADRPALMRISDALLLHADAAFYTDYGTTIDQVNGTIADVLLSDEYQPWHDLIVAFVRRMEFDERLGGTTEAARKMLARYGARRLVHGHTPIPMATRGLAGQPVTEPWVYADGLCTNVDGGMFLGEPGLVYELPPHAPTVAPTGGA